ncbi:hypothetical protein STEG23_027119 [Scotinomys teguina]
MDASTWQRNLGGYPVKHLVSTQHNSRAATGPSNKQRKRDFRAHHCIDKKYGSVDLQNTNTPSVAVHGELIETKIPILALGDLLSLLLVVHGPLMLDRRMGVHQGCPTPEAMQLLYSELALMGPQYEGSGDFVVLEYQTMFHSLQKEEVE